MIKPYNGHYNYNEKVIGAWESTAIGVYYCGYVQENGTLLACYVGKATSDQGIRGRLLQHLSEDGWEDVRHFGYSVCDTVEEAEYFEASEIIRIQPKYNKQRKWSP